jgi:thiol-disulfide isomerase/thioredoxin
MSSSASAATSADFVPEFFLRELKSSARKGEFALVQTLLSDYEERFGRDAFYAEALSWVARSASSKGFSAEARDYANRAYALACQHLGGDIAVAGSPVALAVGAAIEVEAQLRTAEGGEAAAVGYLTEELERFAAQPFRIRIRKNLHALSLPGSSALPLDWDPLPGTSAGNAALLEAPCLLFFWAHWCSDSRAQARTLTRLQEDPETAVRLVAPTRLFGYITKGTPATEAEELAHILEIRKVDYPVLGSAVIPFGTTNFDRYGASTFPTLVGIQPGGKVAFFHAGTLKAEDLAARVRQLG